VTASFAYDGTGRREKKTINTAQTNFLYDGLNPVQENSGAVMANMLTALSIDGFITRTDTATGVTSSSLTDALGSILALTNSSGVVQTEYQYEPFGNTSATGANSSSYQYTGRENDGTGFSFMRARYYSPQLHRWIAEDPLEFGGGQINLYAYSGNDPISFKDPLGLCSDPGGGGLRYCTSAYIPDSMVLLGWGDNRRANSQGGTHSVKQTLDGHGVPEYYPGVSEPLVGPGITGSLRDCLVSVFPLPLGGRKVNFKCEAQNGFYAPPWPLIYDFTLLEGVNGTASVISARGTTFPSYEIWQYGGPKGPVLVYDYLTTGWVGDLLRGSQPLPLRGQ
jgi:RHS repeat-associated protein